MSGSRAMTGAAGSAAVVVVVVVVVEGSCAQEKTLCTQQRKP